MIKLLLSLHKIAATRGDGLRPELLRLFERSQAEEANRVSPTSGDCENRCVTELETNHALPDPKELQGNVLPMHDHPRKRA